MTQKTEGFDCYSLSRYEGYQQGDEVVLGGAIQDRSLDKGMLNALLPGTVVPVHRHPMSNENVICLCGKLVEVLYEEVDERTGFEQGMDAMDVPNGRRLKEVERIVLDPSAGSFGCVVPAGVWHTVEVIEPSVIYEAKDGAYGSDGSETFG